MDNKVDSYIEMLKKSVERVEADFNFSYEIDHNSSKGTFREHIVKRFLRPFLPGCYGISSGQAFDEYGNKSKQLDIVIYDSLFSYIAPFSAEFYYFPCESIYGNIEVKSQLDKNSLEEAIENIRSLKELIRQPVDTFYINAMTPLVIKNITFNIESTNEYFGIIFAYKSISSHMILEHLKKSSCKKEFLPNMIVLFNDKKIILRYKELNNENKYEISAFKDFDGYMVLECKESILAEFLLLLFISLRSITLKAMDIEKIFAKINGEVLSFQGKGRIIDNIKI